MNRRHFRKHQNKTYVPFKELSDIQKKVFWLCPSSVNYIPYATNCESSYTFARKNSNTNCASILLYLNSLDCGTASKMDILQDVMGINIDKVQENVNRYRKELPCYKEKTAKEALRGRNSTLFASMHEAGLIKYDCEDRTWAITGLGYWYVEKILGCPHNQKTCPVEMK